MNRPSAFCFYMVIPSQSLCKKNFRLLRPCVNIFVLPRPVRYRYIRMTRYTPVL
ncbi:hypothetical protein C8Q70DRAFT_947250 [Cubamyces menziesii]|nr:hypothetical protein C8Q70DRAFT_947250 [Cubamyces menziesii]